MVELKRDNDLRIIASLFAIQLSRNFGMLTFSFARSVYIYSVNFLGRVFAQPGLASETNPKSAYFFYQLSPLIGIVGYGKEVIIQ